MLSGSCGRGRLSLWGSFPHCLLGAPGQTVPLPAREGRVWDPGQKSHGPGAVYGLISSPLLPSTEDVFQRQGIYFSLALPAQSFVSFEAMQVRDPCTTAQSSSVLKQKGM